MELYWLLRLPHLHMFLCGVGVMSLIIAFIFVCATSDNSNYYPKIEEQYFDAYVCLGLIICSALSFLLMCFIPTRTDLAIMMGWDALNSNNVQEVIEILKDKIR